MMKATPIKLTLAVAAIFFAFTNFYGISYLLVIGLAASYISFSRTFSTVFGRALLSLLFFCACIMCVGLFAWVFHFDIQPIYIIGLFALFTVLIHTLAPGSGSSSKFMDKGDMAALAVSLVAPLAILFSFYLPHPSNAATYQLLANGWDNGWHIDILQNTAEAHGYVYGKSEGIKTDQNSRERFLSYPQGWHLANSNFVNGFGGSNLFSPTHPVRILNIYLGIYAVWFMLAAFTFSRLTWRLTSLITPKNDLSKWTRFSLYAIATLMIQAVVLYGALAHGFPNYLACIAYVVVLSSFLIDKTKEGKRPGRAFIASSLLILSAITLTWLLPAPAIALVIFLSLVARPAKAHLGRLKRSDILLLLWGVAMLFIVIAQIVIFMLYTNTRNGQLNEGSVSGSFPISQVFVGAIALITLLCVRYLKAFAKNFVVITGAFALLIFEVYSEQIFTTGSASYYFVKALGLLLVVIGIFFVPAVTAKLMQINKSAHLSGGFLLLAALTGAVFIFISADQSTLSIGRLFQPNSKVAYQPADLAINYLERNNPQTEKFIILRHLNPDEDKNGDLVSKIANLNYSCATWVSSQEILRQQLEALKKCAEKIAPTKITVVTSQKTNDRVMNLRLNNIKTVYAPSPEE